MADKENKCSKCEKTATYRDKFSQLYCEECYWKDKNRPSFETYQNSDIYKECPYCTAGDLCGIGLCFGQCGCGIYHPEGGKKNCLTCQQRNQRSSKEQQNQKREQINAICSDCFAKLAEMGQKEKKQLTVQDYQTFKAIQRKSQELTTNKPWLKEDLSGEAAWIEAGIDNLQKCLPEMEKIFPEQIRVRAKWLNENKKRNKKGKRRIPKYCSHPQNQIYWPRAKGEHPFCLNCGDNESNNFLFRLQTYHSENIRDWLGYRQLNPYSELKDTKYQFDKLTLHSFLNLEEIQQAYLEIEEELSQIAYEKNLDRSGIVAIGDECKDREDNSQLGEREREREREQKKLQKQSCYY